MPQKQSSAKRKHKRCRATQTLAFGRAFGALLPRMPLPSEPVTLTVAQLDELNKHLSTMRHDINNNLSLIIAAAELIRHKPQMAERMLATLTEQPPKIAAALRKFTAEFEQTLGITRP